MSGKCFILNTWGLLEYYRKCVVLKRVDKTRTSHLHFVFVVQLLSCVWLFAIPWTTACQASLSFTIFWSLLKLISIESVMPFNHLTCHPFPSCPHSFPASGSFPVSQHCVRWPKYSSFSISSSSEYPGLISFELTGLISLLSKELSWVFSSTTVQKHQFFGA